MTSGWAYTAISFPPAVTHAAVQNSAGPDRANRTLPVATSNTRARSVGTGRPVSRPRPSVWMATNRDFESGRKATGAPSTPPYLRTGRSVITHFAHIVFTSQT